MKCLLKNAERYITPELKEFENKVLSAESMAITRELELYDALCQEISSHVTSIISFANIVATLDQQALLIRDNALQTGYDIDVQQVSQR